MSSSRDDKAYLAGVLEAWRAGFADAEGDNMVELYGAAAARARADDWTELRPLLAVLRTVLRINSTLAVHVSSALRESIEPTADAATADELWALHEHLSAALRPLGAVLAATEPAGGDPGWLGAGRPRRPVRVPAPDEGSLHALLGIPLTGAALTVFALSGGVRAMTQESRVWWRGFRVRVGLDQPAPTS